MLAVGEHSRNIGKTSASAALIRHLRDRKWAALKVTLEFDDRLLTRAAPKNRARQYRRLIGRA